MKYVGWGMSLMVFGGIGSLIGFVFGTFYICAGPIIFIIGLIFLIVGLTQGSNKNIVYAPQYQQYPYQYPPIQQYPAYQSGQPPTQSSYWVPPQSPLYYGPQQPPSQYPSQYPPQQPPTQPYQPPTQQYAPQPQPPKNPPQP